MQMIHDLIIIILAIHQHHLDQIHMVKRSKDSAMPKKFLKNNFVIFMNRNCNGLLNIQRNLLKV